MKQPKYSNLTKGELKALEELKSRDDIVITKADKGGTVVIMDVKDYVKEAERQLNTKEHYRCLPNDPTEANNEAVNTIISRFENENLITKQIAEGLKTT